MAKVKVYSTLSCPWCRVAKDYLRSREVAFEDIDVGLDRGAAQELVAISGQYGVPVITVDDAVVIGFDRAKLEQLLAKSA